MTAPLLGSAADTPTIVTAFFDLGRENWAGAVAGDHIAPWMSSVEVPDFFARSNQLYLDRFANLAALKNPMVVFTEDRFCQFVHDARRAHGLQDHTRIVACKSPFRTSTPLDHAIERTRKAIARPEFGSFVARPYCPEHWNPHYVVMTMFKFTLVNTAIEMGLIDTPSLAWIDFGYCRDDDRFDKTRRWSFPCRDRIHVFHIQEPDDRPIFDVVRSGMPSPDRDPPSFPRPTRSRRPPRPRPGRGPQRRPPLSRRPRLCRRPRRRHPPRLRRPPRPRHRARLRPPRRPRRCRRLRVRGHPARRMGLL